MVQNDKATTAKNYPTTIKNMKAAAYYTTTTKDDAEINAQRNEVQWYAEKFGYTNMPEYIDNCCSRSNLDRPAFKALQADIEAGKVNLIFISTSVQKWRNAVEIRHWLREMAEKGVVVISADGKNNIKRIAVVREFGNKIYDMRNVINLEN
jgi:DNA invertase Pin-like site-specific DNA recombinase